jgi:hypothetical protein
MEMVVSASIMASATQLPLCGTQSSFHQGDFCAVANIRSLRHGYIAFMA